MGSLSANLNSIGEKLHEMSKRVGVGKGVLGNGSKDAMLRARDDLIVGERPSV